jgi:hypothetical protein
MALELKLYPYQVRAMRSQASELLVGGSAGPGKSYFLRAAATIWALEVPGISIFLFRRLYKELLPNHIYGAGKFMEMYKEMMDAGDADFNKSEGVFTFYNDSRIQLCHAQYEDDVLIYLGAEFNVLLIDEATQFSEKMIRFLRSRVRLGSLNVPEKWKGKLPKAIYATNPGGVSHNYFKSGFVNHGAGKVHQAPDEDGGMVREYIPALYTDNKVMMANDPTYAGRLKGLGDEKLVEAYLKGSWDISADGMFAALWDPRIHVIDQLTVPASWRIDRGYDHGSSAPAATLYFAESNGEEVIMDGVVRHLPINSIIIIGEVYFADEKFKGLNLTVPEMADRMIKYEFATKIRQRVKAGPADTAIFDAAPGYESVAKKFAKSGIGFEKADKSPGTRKRGILFMKQMLLAAKERRPDVPHLYVVRRCSHTIRTLPNLPKCPDDPDDVDSTAEDHIFDVIRYRVLKARNVAKTATVNGV